MDFQLDILISKDDICKVDLSEQMVGWGEETFHQDPPKYEYDTKLVFEQFNNLEYYKKYYREYLEDDLDIDNYIALRLLGEDILDLELLINNSQNISNNPAVLFLHELYKIESFALFLIRDEEYIDERCRINNDNDLIELVCNSLKWESPKGALITKA